MDIAAREASVCAALLLTDRLTRIVATPSVDRLGSNTLSGVSLVLPVSFASLFPLPTAVGDFALGETVCTTGATSTAPAPAWGDRCALVCRPGTGSGRHERCVLANRSTQSRSM
jgi:hypothetical protein